MFSDVIDWWWSWDSNQTLKTCFTLSSVTHCCCCCCCPASVSCGPASPPSAGAAAALPPSSLLVTACTPTARGTGHREGREGGAGGRTLNLDHPRFLVCTKNFTSILYFGALSYTWYPFSNRGENTVSKHRATALIRFSRFQKKKKHRATALIRFRRGAHACVTTRYLHCTYRRVWP